MPAYRTRESSRHLEVSTDAPPPPTVAIISPTPRAFSFPFNTNDHDVRLASASSSPLPFEADPKAACSPPPIRAFSPSSSIGSETSSNLSATSARSSQASHKRRRSTASEIVERRPKKGDEDYIKRPENAFILFRRKCCEDRQAQEEAEEATVGPVKKPRQADLSKTISQQWKGLSSEERHYWEELAKEKKKEHEAMYPNYVYRPQRVKSKAKKGKGKRADGEQETDAESSISFVLPVPSPTRSSSRDSAPLARGQNRRAVSAPTPPPAYQTIQLPTVHMPSCPTSPSFVPRISRRSPHPRIPPPTDDRLTYFEHLPNDQLFPPQFQPSSAFEPNAQTDQLYEMFQMEQSSLQTQSNGPQLLHSLTIPRDPPMSSHLMSPTESIASSQFLSPIDSFSPVSPSSPPGGPFTPAGSLSMMALSLAHGGQQQPQQRLAGIPENPSAEMQSSGVSYPSFTWPGETLWPDETLIPDDFDLNSIPPIELGMSKFDLAQLDSEMQQNLSIDIPSGYEFDGEFPPIGEENDFHDAAPGHDPFAGFGTYDNSMTW
ncbi:hypothetical protein WOLCODRAFT_139706 [Wolfiporia cocos MD-104 SS10]|uniref:HMG box domain-containing protein n=1 Tax=Wolfiporia cocos (strain MD-104) TaxID=742152 RepID=A0A2H3J022_WOLCO|nr:hypothetical protein WOLCODRAFT_139706 [Wolfiporia cocos MD-104 SS10]